MWKQTIKTQSNAVLLGDGIGGNGFANFATAKVIEKYYPKDGTWYGNLLFAQNAKNVLKKMVVIV